MQLRTSLRHYVRRQTSARSRDFVIDISPTITKVADDLERRLGATRLPPPALLSSLADRLRSALESQSLASVAPRDWLRAPYVFWTEPKPILAESVAFVEAFFRAYAASDRRRSAKALIFAYITGFEPHSPLVDRIGKELSTLLATTRLHSLQIWASRSKRFLLFEQDRAPAAAAKYILTEANSVEAAFDEIGLGREKLWSAFGRKALEEAFTEAGKTFATADEEFGLRVIMRLREWLELDKPLKNLTHGVKCDVAIKLLSPWARREPQEALREALKALVLDMLGDPRGTSIQWDDPRLQQVREVMQRWFIEETIDLFFRVIDKSADPFHWEDRREFWSGFRHLGAIRDAWVAFGPKVLPIARNIRDGSTGRSFRFAELRAPNDRSHSVLFLRIRDLVVADYSHSGSCRFFYSTNPSTPEFYESEYADSAIRAGASDAAVHQSGWQGRFALLIYNQTGVRHPSPLGYRG